MKQTNYRRFKFREDTDSNSFVLLDQGDLIQPKPHPVVWAVFPIYDKPDGKAAAESRASFVTGMLNGIRDVCEQVDIS